MNIDLNKLIKRVEKLRKHADNIISDYDDATIGCVLAVLYELVDRGE